MDARRWALGLLAMAMLLPIFLGAGEARPLGIDLSIGGRATSLVLSAASFRLTFNFEHSRSKMDSLMPGVS